jgi:hypothetical protein
MAFMEGQREVGIMLLSDIMSACPNQYILMMEERNARQSAIDARFSRSGQNGDGRDSESGPDSTGSGDGSDDDDAGAEAEPGQ